MEIVYADQPLPDDFSFRPSLILAGPRSNDASWRPAALGQLAELVAEDDLAEVLSDLVVLIPECEDGIQLDTSVNYDRSSTDPLNSTTIVICWIPANLPLEPQTVSTVLEGFTDCAARYPDRFIYGAPRSRAALRPIEDAAKQLKVKPVRTLKRALQLALMKLLVVQVKQLSLRATQS